MPSRMTLHESFVPQKIEKPSWPDWTGMTAVCMATGPSLTREQVAAVKSASVKTIAINDLGLSTRDPSASWCHIWYAADWQFWHAYKEQAARSLALKVTADTNAMPHGVVDLFLDTKKVEKAKEYAKGYAISGGHSGFQALQVAIFCGATRVCLVGYDCKPKGKDTNYFGRKPEKLHRASSYNLWPQCYQDLKLPAGVEVINCTPDSAINAYQFKPIAEVL